MTKEEGYLPDTLPREGALYQIHWRSLNTHQSQHRSGGGQLFEAVTVFKELRSGKKKEHKPKRLGPDIFWWGEGSLPREGVGGQKVRYLARNPRKTNFLVGCPGILVGTPLGVPEKFERFVFYCGGSENSSQEKTVLAIFADQTVRTNSSQESISDRRIADCLLLSCKCHPHSGRTGVVFGINNCIDRQNKIREE